MVIILPYHQINQPLKQQIVKSVDRVTFLLQLRIEEKGDLELTMSQAACAPYVARGKYLTCAVQ